MLICSKQPFILIDINRYKRLDEDRNRIVHTLGRCNFRSIRPCQIKRRIQPREIHLKLIGIQVVGRVIKCCIQSIGINGSRLKRMGMGKIVWGTQRTVIVDSQ